MDVPRLPEERDPAAVGPSGSLSGALSGIPPSDDALRSDSPGTSEPGAEGVGWAGAGPRTDMGIPGRTRPRFEELPPGPPTWPGWLAIGVGFGALFLAYAEASLSIGGTVSASDLMSAGIAALAGALLTMGGLVWLAIAGIRRRRVLGGDRYRGPSVVGLLAIVILGGNLAALPLLIVMVGGDPTRFNDPGVVTVELLLTPVSFLVVYGLFVALPRALPGVRLWAGVASLRQLLAGAGMGAVVWFAMGLLSGLVNIVITRITGQPLGGEQAVAGLAERLPFFSAVATVAILAPVAEEFFFRGAVLNAWEREHGTRQAILGSALLFAVVHIVGGTALAVAQVFLLGLILGAVYARTRSLATAIGLHGAFNLASVLALFLVPR